jgi:hypothetical protein
LISKSDSDYSLFFETSYHAVKILDRYLAHASLCPKVFFSSIWESIMWNDNKDDLATGSAGMALLCSILNHYLSDRRPDPQPLSETLCWIILPLVFKIAGARREGKYPKQEKQDAINLNPTKKSVISPRSLWVVSFCLVIYWVFAAENALVAFVPALAPLLLFCQKHLLRHDTEIPSASPPASQAFSYLCNTVWGSALVALFSIYTLKSDWHIRASDLLLIVPVAALLVCFFTLDLRPRISNNYYRLLPPFDFEDAVNPLSLRVLCFLVIALGFESLAFGSPVFSSYTPALALTKALFWYFTTQAVCTAFRDSRIFLVLILFMCRLDNLPGAWLQS